MSNESEARLYKLLENIFEDDVVDVGERSSLLEFQASGELDIGGTQRVFARFVDAKWGAAMADGTFTHHESLVMRRILEELELPETAIPLQLRMALRNS